MAEAAPELLVGVAGYYAEKLREHGATPRGVDWNGAESQRLRFRQLARIIGDERAFSVSDLGCGYGAFYDYLSTLGADITYHGYDVAESMIHAAKARHQDANVRFSVASLPRESADYGMASGIFNVRLNHCDADWLAYIHLTLDALHRTSRKGFSFNCLTSYSDADKMRSDLYYADPCALFDRCKRLYSPQVALLHDYGLYEFTILVRR